jgi:MATE family multidrug resistance protein
MNLKALDLIFITHLHSDHVLELGALIHTAWTTGITTPIHVYGPPGIAAYWQGFMAAMAVLMWLSPELLIALFIDRDSAVNAEVVRLAVSFLAIAALFQIVDGAQVVGAGMLRGLHDTSVPMLFAAFGYWVVGIGVGAWLAFSQGWNGVGIWVGLATGLGIVSVLMLVRWSMRARLGLLPSQN